MQNFLKYDYKVLFDSVLVGTEAVQTLPIPNGHKNNKWTICQKPDADHSLNAFVVKKRVNNNKHEVVIKYRPLQANQFHINYYLIKNIDKNDIILYVRGNSIGLCVQMSVKHLCFYRLKKDIRTKAVIELQNKSDSKLTFQFYIDNTQKIFEIEPLFGEVAAQKYLYVTIKFVTMKKGPFFLDVPCLISYHSPVFVELFGINSKKLKKDDLIHFRSQNLGVIFENGYERFLKSTFGYLGNKPIIQLSKKPGNLSVKQFHSSNLIEISNLSDYCVEVKWDINEENTFSLSPTSGFVRPKFKSYVETKFSPKILENLYGCELYGRGFIYNNSKSYEDPKNTYFPIHFRLIGHAFNETNIWIPSAELCPKYVVMPVCVKNKSVFSTFLIKKMSNYPVTFEFLHPESSNFQVKPLIGIIDKCDYQLFIVKFSCQDDNNTNTNNNNSYCFEEKWRVQYNQSPDIYDIITFKAFVHKLTISVGDDLNRIYFKAAFPGCLSTQIVPLINRTQNIQKFKFTTNKWFWMEPKEGVIESYSRINLKWFYLSDCDVPNSVQINYELRPIQESKLILEHVISDFVTIYASCAFGKLCSSPSRFDFESIVCCEPIYTKFTLYNFSQVPLHFTLHINETYGISEEKPISLFPTSGSLLPGHNLIINVTILTMWSCLSSYSFSYILMTDESCQTPIPFQGKTFSTSDIIYRLDYFSYYPTLKFIEIYKCLTGPLYGLLSIWEYFNINSLNDLLRSIRQNETQQYFIKLPDAEAELNISKSIVFMIKNVTNSDTTCRFERKKICDCKLKEVVNTKGIGSFRKYSYEHCLHRKLVEISTTNEIVLARSTVLITIDINYVLFGPQEACMLMHLSHNRTIELYFKFNGLKPGDLSTYSTEFTFPLHDVFVGEYNPDLQIYWFLNNTRTPSRYNLDVTELEMLNKKFGFKIMECMNPSEIVAPKTRHTLRLLFAPITIGRIELEIPFRFGNHFVNLKITGRGTAFYTSPLDHLYLTADIGQQHIKNAGFLVNISTKHIIIRGLPMNSTTTRIFSLRNVSKENSVGFSFSNCVLEGIFWAWVRPQIGLLGPGEHIALIMNIMSGSVATTLRGSIICHLVNQTLLKKHLETNAEYHKQADLQSDHFQIFDDGKISYPDAPNIEISPNPKIFHRKIAVTCHVISQRDMDIKMVRQEQVRQNPLKDFTLKKQNFVHKLLIPRTQFVDEPKTKCYPRCCKNFSDEAHVAIQTVFNCLVQDVLFGKKFQQRSYNIQTNRKFKYYAELKVDRLSIFKETEMIELIAHRIPKWFLAETFQILLADCVLQQFGIGQYPFKTIKVNNQEKDFVASGSPYTEKFLFLFKNL